MKKVIKYGLILVGGFVVLLVGVAVLGLAVGLAGAKPSEKDTTTVESVNNVTAPETPQVMSQEAKKDDVPAEYKSALNQANMYSQNLHLSKRGIYDQLVSEYGGKFQPEAAQYAVDNVKADWNANALAQAKSYQDTMSMSPAAIKDQLMSDYGAKFTPEEAEYAVQNLNK